MSEELAERLNNWAMDAFEGCSLIGAVQDISEGARVVSDAARTERNRDMWKAQCENQAAELTTLRAENELMREALAVLRDLPIVENDGTDTLHLGGGDYTGPAVDFLFSVVRKIKDIARNALAQVAK